MLERTNVKSGDGKKPETSCPGSMMFLHYCKYKLFLLVPVLP
jgi:hypothetical protein